MEGLRKGQADHPRFRGASVQDIAEQRRWAAANPLRRGGAAREVLVVCSTFRDHRELPRLARPGLTYLFHDYASTSLEELLGVTDSIFFPGALAFSRFEYPSALPDGVQERMADIARRVMRGIGFDNGLFNIEMMYDARRDRIAIIEINPRMASQFADLYEKVDGTNAYEILVDIGTGVRPTPKRRRGPYQYAASWVLRTFQDCLVAALPSAEQIEELERCYPDLRVELHATAGRKLSDELQDGASFRYGIVNLGGSSRTEVLQRLEDCRARLGFILLPMGSTIGGEFNVERSAACENWS